MDELIILIGFGFGAILLWVAGQEKPNRWDR